MYYGTDDRLEVIDLVAPAHRAAADCVAAVFFAPAVQERSDGSADLATTPFARERCIDPRERFYGQPAGAIATAFLVAPDLAVTAGHVVDRLGVAGLRLVFGFRVEADGRARLSVAREDVFEAATLIAAESDDAGADWALVRLARPALGRFIPALRRERPVVRDESLYTIGHPRGLPAKFAGNAIVRADDHPDYFVANLDTAVHCSGSPVFGADDRVVGVVCRGKQDLRLAPDTGLRIAAVAPDDGGRGEDCTRVTTFACWIAERRDAGQFAR